MFNLQNNIAVHPEEETYNFLPDLQHDLDKKTPQRGSNINLNFSWVKSGRAGFKDFGIFLFRK